MNNTFGTKRAADVDIENDIDVYMMFQKSYNDTVDVVKKISASDVISKVFDTDDVTNIITGVYSFSLQNTVIQEYGYGNYYINVKPKKYPSMIIKDCGQIEGTLQKGILIDLNTIDESLVELFSASNSLTGYRVEYGENIFRIITSNNRVEPVISSSVQTGSNIQYRLNDNSSLLFITLNTVDVNTNLNNNSFIGSPNQNITITNTFFDPVMLTFEVKEHDTDTVVNLLGYNGIVKNYEKGLVTYFDENEDIVVQHLEYTEKNNLGDDIKKYHIKNENVDTSEEL